MRHPDSVRTLRAVEATNSRRLMPELIGYLISTLWRAEDHGGNLQSFGTKVNRLARLPRTQFTQVSRHGGLTYRDYAFKIRDSSSRALFQLLLLKERFQGEPSSGRCSVTYTSYFGTDYMLVGEFKIRILYLAIDSRWLTAQYRERT